MVVNTSGFFPQTSLDSPIVEFTTAESFDIDVQGDFICYAWIYGLAAYRKCKDFSNSILFVDSTGGISLVKVNIILEDRVVRPIFPSQLSYGSIITS